MKNYNSIKSRFYFAWGHLWVASLLAGLVLAAESAPIVSQFDTLSDGSLEIQADFGRGISIESVIVQELESDQKTTVGNEFSVKTVSASGLIKTKEYPCEKPICNLFIGFAGKHTDLKRVLREPQLAKKMVAGLSGVHGESLRIWLVDPSAGGGVVYPVPSLNGIGEGLAKVADRIEKGCPSGFFGWLFGASPYTDLSTTVNGIRSFIVTDKSASSAMASVSVIFWADGIETDKLFRPSGMSGKNKLSVSICEVSYCKKDASAVVRKACASTQGAYVAYGDIRRRGISGVGEAAADLAIGSAGRLLASMCLFRVKSANLEDTASCWFSVKGSSVGGVPALVVCDRSAEAVKAARRRRSDVLAGEIESNVKKGNFKSGYDLLPELAQMGGDRGKSAGVLFAGVQGKALEEAEMGDYDSAFARVDELQGYGGDAKVLQGNLLVVLQKQVAVLAERDDFAGSKRLLTIIEKAGGDCAAAGKPLFARMRQKALGQVTEKKYKDAFALVSEIRKAGGESETLGKEIYDRMTAESLKLAEAAEFAQAITLYNDIATFGGNVVALGKTLGKKIGDHAVSLAERGLNDRALSEYGLLGKVGADSVPVRDRLGQVLRRQAETLADKAEYASALDRLVLVRKIGASAGDTQAEIVAAWKIRLAKLAGKGKYDEAVKGEDELERLGFLPAKQKSVFHEELMYKGGLWFAVQSDGKSRALDLLAKWRESTKAGGRYGADSERGIVVARERARLLSKDANRDAECAVEINELVRLKSGAADDADACRMVAKWLMRDGGTLGFSARIALLENWNFVDAALKGDDPELQASRRFFRLATSLSGAKAELKMMREAELDAEPLDQTSVNPAYTALSRALTLAPLYRVVLDALPGMGVTTNVTVLLANALAGTGAREAFYYRDSNPVERFLLASDTPYCMNNIGSEIGFGVAVAPALLQRLHSAGQSVFLEGEMNGGCVCVCLIPLKDERSFFKMTFIGTMADAMKAELGSLMTELANKDVSVKNSRKSCLELHDIRNNEIIAHSGAEFLAQAIRQAGTDVFLAKGGQPLLSNFLNAVPESIRGYIVFDKMAFVDDSLVVVDGSRVSAPSSLAKGVKPVHKPGVGSYAVWEDPCFEVGLPIYAKGTVTGFLCAGFRTIER